MFAPVEAFYRWNAENEVYLKNRDSVANVLLLQSNDRIAFQGMYAALMRSRIPFDSLPPFRLTAKRIERYDVLVLLNVSHLSDSACRLIEGFFGHGGGIVATYETSLANEQGIARGNFGLADVFGIRYRAGELSESLEHAYGRFEDRSHPLFEGIEDTDRTLVGGKRLPVEVAEPQSSPLTLIPTYPSYPPETAFPSVDKTDIALIFQKERVGRSVYFPFR